MPTQLVLALALLTPHLALAHGDGPAVFYVAPDGKDSNPGTLARPFATLRRACGVARTVKDQAVQIVLRGGTYTLEKPLVLTPEDSGTTFLAYENERPVLSGGAVIRGWEREEEGVYGVTLPAVREGKWTFRQLFVAKPGDRFAQRRYRPSRGAFVIAGLTASPHFKTTMRHRQSQRDFIFHPGDIVSFANGTDVEVVALHDWSASRMRIESLDMEKRVVTFTGWPVYRIGHWYKDGRNPYFIENVKEDFSKPGLWYLDRPTGRLEYRPMPGEDMKSLVVVAPVAEQLVRLEGDPSKPDWLVEGITFRGITFAHTNWALPQKGYSSGQGMIGLPAAVDAKGARGCRFERCTFAHLGAYALRLGEGCHANAVEGCHMVDLAGGGVPIGVTNRKAKPPILPTGNTVSNCVISDGGLDHFSPHGIWVGITDRTTLRHNVARRFPYSNISIGWCWDDKPSSAGATLIENNHIHDSMMLLADGGAIYSLGWQPGVVIRGNYIHGVHRSRFTGRAPNNGIFLDEGSKGFHIEGNVFHDIAQEPIRFNRGKRELHTWKDNVYGVKPGDPKFPTAIAERAGLEPAFRDVDAAVTVPPPVHHAMSLPKPPPPKPIADDFETTAVGRPPRRAAIHREQGAGTIRVTDETAAEGKHSLKFTDAPGLAKSFYPYMSYDPDIAEGIPVVSFAIRVEAGTHAGIDLRQRAHDQSGIALAVGPDGTLSANGKKLLTLPLGTWCRIAVTCPVGKQTMGKGDVAVTLPGQAPKRFPGIPFRTKGFRKLGHLVLTSSATNTAVFYLDDLKIAPAK
ncbi:right-handed parallel beta-helix repeat-containing protein [bacterium]|nr:right-handed parallel beta-helix repeat-containing protein [bacterium]